MELKEETIKIELTEEDAILFREFRQHQDKFKTLMTNGVFNTRNGQAVLNFDHVGTLTQIDVNMIMFKKGYPIIHISNII